MRHISSLRGPWASPESLRRGWFKMRERRVRSLLTFPTLLRSSTVFRVESRFLDRDGAMLGP